MDYKPKGESNSKSQIILIHTSRDAEEYLASLHFRYNLKYDKIPNFLIKKDGEIVKLLSDYEYSGFFDKNEFNEKSIVISLENFGWLEKLPLNNGYINWKGDIYNGDVYEKKWRDYIFWDKYTESQIKSLSDLSKHLLNKFLIPNKVVSNNTKIIGIENYNGITCRSNYSQIYTDLSPAFDFKQLEKLI